MGVKMERFIVRLQKKGYYYLHKIFSKKEEIILGKKIALNCLTKFEGKNRIGDESNIQSTKIGYGSYMGMGCKLVNTEIGKYTSIASYVGIVTGRHPIHEYISTSPMFYSKEFGGGYSYVNDEFFDVYKYVKEGQEYKCKIGSDVWIGEGVRILQGVTIGNGAVVGAYSVVTKDCEPYGVYAGSPARLIKYRFDEETIHKLIQFEWWNQKEEWIIENVEKFRYPDQFLPFAEDILKKKEEYKR